MVTKTTTKPRKSKVKDLFVVDKDAKILFVRMDHCGIPPLVAINEITLFRFGKNPTIYVKVEDLVRWHEKEFAESGGRSGDKELADTLTEILAELPARLEIID